MVESSIDVVELDPPGRAGVPHVDADGGRGVEDRIDVAVGDAGERGHLDRAARRDVPAAVLQERVDEYRLEFLGRRLVEVAVDEHDVGDAESTDRRQAELCGADDEWPRSGGRGRSNGWSVDAPWPLARPYGMTIGARWCLYEM